MDVLLDLTLNNPIFITVSILIIWFAPGIIIRRVAEKKYIDSKKKLQEKRIAKLYPKEKI
tara:strand:- start:410 stop:589 length:180 start_codon:yes stop_codon:yes gene_type:complete